MLNAEQVFIDSINSPVREIRARVELYNGSTLLDVFKYNDRLISFTVERIGIGKFFGYGICQKINVKLIDMARELNITTANKLEVVFSTGSDYIYTFPAFNVSEVHRDENTNELSITGYDALYAASCHTVNELSISNPYTIKEFAEQCGALLGVPVITNGDAFNISYDGGANFEGNESIRVALDAVAEATQTIYYLDGDWNLTFKRIDKDGSPLLTIDKDKYFTLDSSANRRLGAICNVTELGDNVIASLEQSGTTQYIRDNPFLEMREDVGELLEAALDVVGGLTINQFVCDWRGNYLLEIGDKIALTTKDNTTVVSYLLNDTITYDGALRENTQWELETDEADNEYNSSSIGEALRQTYARVDKVNKQIDMVVSETSTNSESISNLQLTTDTISASVQRVEENAQASIDSLNNDVAALTSQVEAKMSAEDLQIQISTAMAQGTDKVVTSTGYTFDSEGLTVSKSGSEMSTQITDDGMKVYRDNAVVLTANNRGVDAVNLHATTYLIIGTNSRFEDYGDSRTGCFWIGGI